MGVLLNVQLETSLRFLGAGGHVEISGIWYFCALGVVHPILLISSIFFNAELSEHDLTGEDEVLSTFVSAAVDISFFFTILLGFLALFLDGAIERKDFELSEKVQTVGEGEPNGNLFYIWI